jgi:hypothetical protein
MTNISEIVGKAWIKILGGGGGMSEIVVNRDKGNDRSTTLLRGLKRNKQKKEGSNKFTPRPEFCHDPPLVVLGI